MQWNSQVSKLPTLTWAESVKKPDSDIDDWGEPSLPQKQSKVTTIVPNKGKNQSSGWDDDSPAKAVKT